jgi:hypothetical protein
VSRLAALWTTIQRIVVDPTSNLTAAVLFLAIAVLVALIIVIALLLWVTGGGRSAARRAPGRDVERDADEYEYPELSAELEPVLPGDEEEEWLDEAERGHGGPPGRLARWLAGPGGTALVWGIVVLAVVGAGIGTSRDEYCADACHSGDAAKSRKADAHKGVACVRCHEDAGPASAVAVVLQRTAHLASQIADIGAYKGAVPASRCLACHGSVLKGTVTIKDLGVRISHERPIAGGMACDDCHEKAGHGGSIAARGMATCVPCHDGKKASSTCSVCHTGDTSEAVRISLGSETDRPFPRIQLGPVRDCGGCHDQARCDACHGLRLPHPDQFVKWQHARYAGFEKKQVCWRCHESRKDCGGCHTDWNKSSHGPAWRSTHGDASPDMSARCACHWPRMPEEGRQASGTYCRVCH